MVKKNWMDCLYLGMIANSAFIRNAFRDIPIFVEYSLCIRNIFNLILIVQIYQLCIKNISNDVAKLFFSTLLKLIQYYQNIKTSIFWQYFMLIGMVKIGHIQDFMPMLVNDIECLPIPFFYWGMFI